MKKNILFILSLALLTIGFTSCEKQSAGKTGMVDYVVLKLVGEEQVFLKLGEKYIEDGWTATDKGKDVANQVSLSITDMKGNEVDEITTETPGFFTITYSATSEDKVTISVERQVFAYDPSLTVSIKGAFTVDYEKSERIDGSRDWTWAQWSAMYTDPAQWGYADYSLTSFKVTFSEVAPGIYKVDDLLGGFYTGLRGYGPYMKESNGAAYYNYYSMGGMVILNADKTIDLVASHVEAWGDSLDDFTGVYDDATNTIEMHSIYGGGMDFHVIMVKK